MSIYWDDDLYHSGIKDMKWYRRRFQNYDGTLTPAGRERYGVGPPRIKSAIKNYKNKKKMKKLREAKIAKAKQRAFEEAERIKKEKYVEARRKEISKNAQTLMDNIDEARELFTLDELRNLNSRYDEEGKIFTNAQNEKDQTRKKIDRIVKASKTALDVIDEATKWYGVYYKLSGKKARNEASKKKANATRSLIETALDKLVDAKREGDALKAGVASSQVKEAFAQALLDYDVAITKKDNQNESKSDKKKK